MNIVGYAYTIKPDPGMARRDNAFGSHSPGALEIEYDQDTHRQMQESSILHEIIEAINYHLELRLRHNQIMALETGLYSTLIDAGIDLSRLIP